MVINFELARLIREYNALGYARLTKEQHERVHQPDEIEFWKIYFATMIELAIEGVTVNSQGVSDPWVYSVLEKIKQKEPSDDI